MQYGPPPFLLNDNELLSFDHAGMLREEHYSHPENVDSWESIMPTLWRFEVRWSIFGLSPLLHSSSSSSRLLVLVVLDSSSSSRLLVVLDSSSSSRLLVVLIIIIIGTFKFSRRHDCQFINRIKNWNWTAAPHWTLSSRK